MNGGPVRTMTTTIITCYNNYNGRLPEKAMLAAYTIQIKY